MTSSPAQLARIIDDLTRQAEEIEAMRGKLSPALVSEFQQYRELDLKARLLRDRIRQLGVRLSCVIDEELESSIPLPSSFDFLKRDKP